MQEEAFVGGKLTAFLWSGRTITHDPSGLTSSGYGWNTVLSRR
ncbi:hypothetical protein QLX08_005615 [Tetragonisca angustula]|uniref:Uncharacterized protein n=1 Tax=Tetragonisca angustula TaxID=166442 RepID=A0AAW0ZXN2_9HYME